MHNKNQIAINHVSSILETQFRELSQTNIDRIPDILRNPFKYDFLSILYVAEGKSGRVKGFALLSHDPTLSFCYLDYLAADQKSHGRGIGGALYERIREEAKFLNAKGIFFECLPDDPTLCHDPEILKENKARLKFYENFGAFPIWNTAYETPISPGDDNPPYLVFDDLGLKKPLNRDFAKKVVKAILQRKYKDICTPDYVKMVIASFKDEPVQIRPPKYVKKQITNIEIVKDRLATIALVINDKHAIHHVRERGYVESPVRIRSILKSLEQTNLFTMIKPMDFSEKYLFTVHDPAYVKYFKQVCSNLKQDASVYPYVFPIRNQARPPTELSVRAGYYCIDTFTPLNRNAFIAAKRSVDCALSAASQILEGFRIAYALIRPPGHHAESKSFGGFCYFNNAAISAQYLSEYGQIAMLDIDYHHGNGQQTIFYDRSDILTVSIHAKPAVAYPYFSGFANEIGENAGKGYNINYPLPEKVDGQMYMKVLDNALTSIKRFHPKFVIVCLGLDTAKGDPTGTWSLNAKDFMEIGKKIGQLNIPSLIIQEGGYNNRSIGSNAKSFFKGICQSTFVLKKY